MLGQISVSMNTVLKFLFINYKIYIQFFYFFILQYFIIVLFLLYFDEFLSE